MKAIIAAIPLALLSACQTPAVDQSQADDQCGASARQHLVGTLESSLDKGALPALTRIIHPTSAVTMDYRTERLNVYVEQDGRISKVRCG